MGGPMNERISHELSTSETPTAQDIAAVDELMVAFGATSEDEASLFFENQLVPVARRIAENVNRTRSASWVQLLLLLDDATHAVASEEIDTLAEDSLARLRGSVAVAASQREAALGNLYANVRALRLQAAIGGPLPPVTVDETGCQLVFRATTQHLSARGFPILYGDVSVVDGAGNVSATFEASTGRSAPNYTQKGGPLPPGRYRVSNFRSDRSDTAAMIRDGVSYSFNLDPIDGTKVYGRSLFRIHPDGGVPGTLGCVGILGEANEQQRFKDLSRQLLIESNHAMQILALAMIHEIQ